MRQAGVLCLLLGLVAPGFSAAGQIDAAALTTLPGTDVTVLGEVHDNPAHHANQARAVGAIAPAALVFEMLSPAQAAMVTPALRADAAALGTALGWEAAGWPDFAMYYPIFQAAPEAAIFGAALPRDAVRRAVSDGAAAVLGEPAQDYGLTKPLAPEVLQARVTLQQEAHCNALPEDLLPGMVEAQRLRDAALARAARQALAETGGPVAVITGNGHARKDWGLAAALSVAAPEVSILTVGQFEEAPDAPPPFDFWLVTAPAEREDPCAGFQKNQQN